MREWLKRVVLKTTVPETVPGVRIPLPPPIVPFFAMRCEHSRELGWALKIPQMKAVCNGFVMVCSCWRVLFGCLCTSEMIYLSTVDSSLHVIRERCPESVRLWRCNRQLDCLVVTFCETDAFGVGSDNGSSIWTGSFRDHTVLTRSNADK